MAEEPQPAAPAPESASGLHKASRWEVFFPGALEADRDAIFISSFPPIIYFWPAILTFLACGFLQWLTPLAPGALGWAAMFVFAFNVLVIVQDFDQKKFLIFMLLIFVMGLGAWIVNMKGLTFLSTIIAWLIALEPTFSTSAYFIFAAILIGLFAWGMTLPMFDYWKFEHNEFVHYIQPFGRDMSIPRLNSTVSKHVPDMLEYLLTFGGGSLVIKREGRVWATIPHIPFLSRRMIAVEKMLAETRVTQL